MASPEFELLITALAAGGDGIARDSSGRVTFVAGTVPGDRVRVRAIEERKSFARARLVQIVEPSSWRRQSRCALFAAQRCGGCQWQHIEDEQQAAAKTDIVNSALRKLIAAGLEMRPLLSATPPFQWRRRARVHWFRPPGADSAVIGFHGARSDRVVDVADCVQMTPALQLAYGEIRNCLAPALRGSGTIELLANEAGEVQVGIAGSCAPPLMDTLVGRAGIIGVTMSGRTWGAATVVIDDGIPCAASSFAQASAPGNRALVDLVRALADGDANSIVEFYCGQGNLTRVLARPGRQVEAVDTASGQVDLAGVTWRRGDAAMWAGRFVDQGRHFRMAVLDPPRTGAKELLTHLPSMGVETIIYVSCNPATLARDASRLVDLGYQAAHAQAVDMMPQTAHVEVVMLLRAAHSVK